MVPDGSKLNPRQYLFNIAKQWTLSLVHTSNANEREVRPAGAVQVLFPRWWTRMNLCVFLTCIAFPRFTRMKYKRKKVQNFPGISCVCVWMFVLSRKRKKKRLQWGQIYCSLKRDNGINFWSLSIHFVVFRLRVNNRTAIHCLFKTCAPLKENYITKFINLIGTFLYEHFYKGLIWKCYIFPPPLHYPKDGLHLIEQNCLKNDNSKTTTLEIH